MLSRTAWGPCLTRLLVSHQPLTVETEITTQLSSPITTSIDTGSTFKRSHSTRVLMGIRHIGHRMDTGRIYRTLMVIKSNCIWKIRWPMKQVPSRQFIYGASVKQLIFISQEQADSHWVSSLAMYKNIVLHVMYFTSQRRHPSKSSKRKSSNDSSVFLSDVVALNL